MTPVVSQMVSQHARTSVSTGLSKTRIHFMLTTVTVEGCFTRTLEFYPTYSFADSPIQAGILGAWITFRVHFNLLGITGADKIP